MPFGKVDGVVLEKRSPAGQGVRVHRPRDLRSSAAFLWFHGGGYVLGRAALNDRLCGEIARDLGIAVVAAEYRKAPEHPFPAALDDCHAAWMWLQREAAALGIDPARVAVGGESAGGGLAASLAQRLHDEGGIQPVGQLLFCPMLDDRTAARHELDGIDHFVWNNRKNRFGWRSYLGTEPGAGTVPPYGEPARRDGLTGMPPTWIGVSAIELFHSEDLAYAGRLRAANVPVELDVVPGAPHGFESWAPDTEIARRHQAQASAWLRAVLALGDAAR
jgi:acetyl esterase/lipase